MVQEASSCEREPPVGPVWHAGAYSFAAIAALNVNESHQAEVEKKDAFGGSAKRCFDLAISLLLLPLAIIVGLPIACVIALSGGDVIYGHTRVGRSGRPFRCYKFRTMNVAAENELQTILENDISARQQWMDRFKLENDPRVTTLGRWLRKTCLDEIPQIWNVLRGDMSWVGPRPVVAEEMDKYGLFLSAYLVCRPGVSGEWQIRRRSDTSYAERVALDVKYARTWSMSRDLMILLLTVPRILSAGHGG